MTIGDVQKVLAAQLLSGEDMADNMVEYGFGSDLMSDVLAFSKEKVVLLTGLINPHVVKTAEMLDAVAIVFVRGKMPTQEILDLAAVRDIAVLRTKLTLFDACGELYKHGLSGRQRDE